MNHDDDELFDLPGMERDIKSSHADRHIPGRVYSYSNFKEVDIGDAEKLLANVKAALGLVEQTYFWMLKNIRMESDMELRLKANSMLASLRSHIAETRDQTDEEIQNEFEELAADPLVLFYPGRRS
jgi:hypothetical protein